MALPHANTEDVLYCAAEPGRDNETMFISHKSIQDLSVQHEMHLWRIEARNPFLNEQ